MSLRFPFRASMNLDVQVESRASGRIKNFLSLLPKTNSNGETPVFVYCIVEEKLNHGHNMRSGPHSLHPLTVHQVREKAEDLPVSWCHDILKRLPNYL
jgi:hypothetical protein